MDLSKLSTEDKAKLLSQLESEKKEVAAKKEADKEAYKNLKDETILKTFEGLKAISQAMIIVKEQTFENFKAVIDIKNELFAVKSDRQSDTFTTDDGKISIKIGNRILEGWDDTVEVGIEKVKAYLKTLAKDEESGMLVETVMRLISKDRKGNLKASRVLELQQLAQRSGSPELIEAIEIIREAYRPSPSVQFIEVKYKDDKGNDVSLPLSMSAIG